MFSDEFLKGFSSAVQAYAMDKPRGAYDAKPSFTPRTRARFFTRRTRATDQEPDDNRPLSDELMEQLHTQLEPDTFEMLKDELKDALNGTANDQEDPDEEEDKPTTGLSPELIAKICELVGPHLSDEDFEQLEQHLDGMSDKPANDLPPPFSGRPTPGGGQDPSTSASRARSSARSPAEDANRITSPTPGGPLAYDMGVPFTGTRNGVRYLQGKRLNSRPRKVSVSEQQSYANRFPNAARIKVL